MYRCRCLHSRFSPFSLFFFPRSLNIFFFFSFMQSHVSAFAFPGCSCLVTFCFCLRADPACIPIQNTLLHLCFPTFKSHFRFFFPSLHRKCIILCSCYLDSFNNNFYCFFGNEIKNCASINNTVIYKSLGYSGKIPYFVDF